MTTELEREALLAIDQLEARVRELEYERAEPIAIIGMACRYPGCNDPVQLWQLLAAGGDAFEPRDGQEPGGPGRPGRIDALDRFDAAFFRISPREAQRMDPRQRLLLEASWEALEDAGLSPLGLAAAEVGVYVGVSGNGHAPMLLDHEPDIYNVTGTVAGVSAGRISFVLGLRGPSLALDTTCSSSLVAVHLGCQALRARDCELAVVGGVGVMPRAAREQSWWAELGHLSKTGRCRSFDASGDGIVGSDGCGMIVLKRLGAAQRDGDRIAAVIRGTAINHDGVSQGLTVPSGVAQEDVIRRALGDAGLSPRDIDYVECHGTGTALGDPIEIEALGQVARGRALDQPILVGSIKSNLGHTDAAAGVTGLLKVVLALRHERIPKTLHFTAPNPHIPWSALPIRVAAEAVAWPRGHRPRRAGVSSFGLSGTNAHVVVEEAPAAPIEAPAAPPRGAELIVLSAGSEAALAEVARRLRERLIASAMPATEEISHLGDLACSLATRRPHHEHRVAVTATTLDELASALDAIGRGETPRGAAHGQVGAARGQLAWLFTGQGAQRLGMGRGLYASWPVFRDALDAAFAAFAAASPALAQLRDVMWAANDDAGAKRLEQTGWTQPALFAVEWALAALWRSWGIEPDVVCGHSIGELAAAAVAGVLSLDDAARLVAARGQLMQALPAGGAMVAVDGAEADVRAVLADRPAAGHVSLAAINGPASVVLSGALDALTALAGVLGQRGMRTRRLAVSHAFHSDLMAPMLDEFGRVAAQVRFHKPSVPLISNLTGELAGDEITTADYWVRHIREAVRFGDSMGALHARGVDSYVEIGPRPTLVGLVAACLPPGAREPALIASLRPELADEVAVLSALGRCHTQGRPIAWSAVFPTGGRRVELPTYPWQRERHWIDPVPQRVHGKATGHPLLGTRIAAAGVDAAYETSLSTTAYPWLADHRIGERVIVPGTAIAELVRAAAEHYLEDAPEVKRLVLVSPLVLDGDRPRCVQVVITKTGTRAQVYSQPADASGPGFTLHASADIALRGSSPRAVIDLAAIRTRCSRPVDVAAMYEEFAAAGIHYGPIFRGVAALTAGTHEALGEIRLPVGGEASGYGGHPALLDAALQVVKGAAPAGDTAPWVPFELGRVVVHEPGRSDALVHARLAGGATAEAPVVDISVIDAGGALIAELSGLRFRRGDALVAPGTAAAEAAGSPGSIDQLAWRLTWVPAPMATTTGLTGRWLVVTDDEAAAAPLVAALRASQASCVCAVPDAIAAAPPADHVVCLWSPRDTNSGLDGAGAVQLATAALAVVQAVVRQSPPPRLWWLTVGAVDAGDATSACPAAAAVWGLGRTVMHERPELRCTLIDLDGFDRAANALARELAATDDEPQIAWRAGDRFVARLTRAPGSSPAPTGDYELVARDKGTLDSLALIPAARRAPGPGEVELEVRASGINFRDVLNALGTYPGEAGALGNECAGVVVAIGPGVTSVACGDAVMGLVPGGFRRHATVDARLVVAMPRRLSFAQAATVPLVFLTAWYALHDLGKLQPGERLVVHAAAGGVGMAAVQIGRWRGARVLATASRAKWDAVRALGVTDIASSRDVSFAGAFRSAAGGADVVLNALTGEIVDASLSLLGPGGRFLEMGKLGLRSPDEVAAAHPGVRYRAFDLMDAGPDRIAEMLGELIRGFEAGVLQPLPVRSFPITQAEHAFRFMAQARHIGKLALLPVSAPRTGSVLITGGLGGLGLCVARWLVVEQGLRQLVLTGRRGLDTPGAREAVQALEALGARVTVAAIDVTDAVALDATIAAIDPGVPLRGVVHAAGVLDDGVLTEQTAARLAAVLAPKAQGAWNLHRATQALELDFFVLFSSISAAFGAAGQGTYAAANAYLDALASWRRAAGLPAHSLAWGPWAEVGMAASLDPAQRARVASHGVLALPPAHAIALLEHALARPEPQLVVASFDLRAVARAFGGAIPAVWRSVVRTARARTSPTTARSFAQELAALPSEQRLDAVRRVVRGELGRVLSLASADRIPLDRPLKELGLDSLMAIELRNGLGRRVASLLPATLAFDYPTVDAIAHYLLRDVLAVADTAPPQPTTAPSVAALPDADDPIAIVGLGCRFPGEVNDPASLWRLLDRGIDAISEVPSERWDIDAWYDPDPDATGKMTTRWGGFVRGLEAFDPGFFGLSAHEARSVDPRERMLLETAWEALEHAGLTAEQLMGSETGVYMGLCGNDYQARVCSDADRLDAYSLLGTSHSTMVGRLSYWLGLKGPNFPIDTACSSSLVAVHLACQALRSGECSLALAGGANVVLDPLGTVYFSRLRAMSPTGRCHSFAASADGYVRAEGAGVVVLERLSEARRRGHRVLAIIRGSAINQDGRSNGITAPHGPSQQRVIRDALERGGVAPASIGYLECHGTGTPLGDPVEVQAAAAVLGEGRGADEALILGSLKSNIGHAEGAAGIAGLLKVVLALDHEQIPRSLHFDVPNPHIPWSTLPVKVAAAAVPWPRSARPRRAGVSSFGFSGTNAHVVLEEAPVEDAPSQASDPARGAELFVLSARTETALADVARRLRDHVTAHARPLTDTAYSLATQRTHHEHRVAVTAASSDELAGALDAISRGETPRSAAHGQVGAARGQLAWLFTGQGAQRLGMGRGLYASWPVFRDALDAAFAAFAAASPALAQLRDVMWAANDDAGAKRLEQTGWTQPALFAVEWALAALWRSWGIEPDVVCGHSIGELAAAAVAGVLSLDDAARLVAARGQLMQALPAGGAMVAVDGAEADVRAVLADRPAAGHVSLAAINGPASVVLSGALDALTALAGVLGQRGMRTRRLAVSHAFHSDLMAPMLDEFGRVAAQVRFHKPSVPLISNLTGELAGDDITTADYWVRHVREAVRFGDSIRALHARGVDSYVEIGPRPTLVGLVAACLPTGAPEPSLIASLRPELTDEVAVLSALGRCHTQGRAIAWSAVFPDGGQRVALPTYPWQRERHWIDPVPQRVHGKATGHPLLGTRIAAAGVDAAYETSLSIAAYPWLADHRIGERVIVPGTAIAELVRAAAEHYLEDASEVKRLVLQAPLVLDGDKPRRVQVVITESRAQVYSLPADASAWTLHAAAEIAPRAPTPRPAIDLAAIRARCTTPVDVSAMYDGFAATGLHYGPVFRGVAALAAGTHEALGELHLPTAADARGYGGHPALLDAAVQVLRGAVPADNAVAWVPFELGRVVIYEPGTRDVFAHARLADGGTADAAVVDITLMDGAGTLIAELSSVRFRRIDRLWASTGASNAADPLMRQLAWQLAWSPAAVPATSAFPGRWLVVSDDEAAAAPLVAALRASRVPYALAAADAVATALPADHVVCVWPGSTTVPDDERAVQLVTAGLAVVQAVVRQSPPPRLWWLTVGAVDAGDAASACPAAAAVWGLGRTVMHERPELRCTLIDLDGFDRAANALARELAATDDEPQVAWRAGSPCGDRFVARLVRGRAEARVPTEYELVARDKGTLDSLALIPAARRAPGPGEVELEVRASGINFRDVLNALGTYPGEAGALGNECAGVVVAIGPGVTSVACGDAVMGFAPGGAFRRHVTVDARHVAAIPRGLSFAQAATVPLVFLTAWYALHDLGKLQPGERLVVHAAAGGVGMAAVQIGRWRGARVLATASRAKWDAVRALGVTDIASSRDVSFAGAFRSAAGGADVVLNALTGEIVDASLSLLGPGGRFLEMGKLGLRSPDEVAAAHPGVRYRAFDLMDAGPDRIAEMLGELIRGFEAGVLQPLPVRSFPITQAEHAFRFMAQARHIGKLALLPVSAPRTGSVLITGGLGGLGSQVARWLATRGCRELVLTGRRGLDAPGARDTVAAIEALGARVTVAAIDVADRAALARLLDAIPPDRPLRGIIHAAGVLDDGMLHEQTAERCARVLAPKVCGATHLDALTRGLDLEFFVLFSSVAATLGSAAQGTYAAANAFLDALAVRRRADGQPATSVAWGPWDGAGMAGSLDPMLKQRLARSGVRALAPDDALAVLGELLGRDDATAVIARFDLTAIERAFAGSVPALWRRVVAPAQPTQPGQPRLAAASVWLSELRALPAAARLPAILAVVRSEAARVLSLAGPDAVPLDTPFKEIGLDSLMSVELRNALNKRARTTLPATLAFDHPTAQALAAHLLATLFDDAAAGPATTPPAALAAAPSPVASVTSAGSPVEPIAIVGIGCRYPGGVHDAESFWRLLDDGTDAITEVPRDRWNVDAYYDADPEAPDKMYTRRAGFLDNIDQFDARFFGISAREAASMDPQQRLLLEVTWEAFANANQPVEALRGAPVGVFVGICSNDYGDVIRSSGPSDSFSATGNAMSVAAGRLSYAFGFEGPAMSLDTACSSSLVAVHLACQHLRSSECDLAVAAGANLILSPAITVAFCRLRALSPRGTCSAFDADADGYVRAEGCAAIVLKRLVDAERAGDRILGVIRGSAVNHDGRSNGLTAPSGRAQEAVIRRALHQAGLRPADLGYIEAHGTGTRLGDAIELQALGAVVGADRGGEPLVVGSVKTNIGHTEAAAGLAGLIKVVLSLSHGVIPRSLHFATPSPHVPWAELPVRIAREPIAWPVAGEQRFAGVSSFGISGTNAHVVVSTPPPAALAAPAEPQLVVIPLSAKTPTALLELATSYDRFLARTAAASIAEVAHAAAVGRHHFRERAAVIAASRDDAHRELAALAAGKIGRSSVRGRGSAGPPPGLVLVVPAQICSRAVTEYAWPALAKAPAFEAALRDCEAASQAVLGTSLAALLGDAAGPRERAAVQFAIGYALAATWRAWGIASEDVHGDGAGAAVAAALAGTALAEALRLALDDVCAPPAVAVEPDPLASRVVPRLVRGVAAVIVLGPLSAVPAIEAACKQVGISCLPSLAALPGDDDAVMLRSLAALYALGAQIDWRAVYSHRAPRIALPPYPWQRIRYWPTAASAPSAATHSPPIARAE